jgi:hypothetical protein
VDEDKSENALKLPDEDDSQRSYSELSSGSFEDVDVDMETQAAVLKPSA